MTLCTSRRTLALAALGWLVLSARLFAQQPLERPRLVVGFNGHYKAGAWAPVSVTLSGPPISGKLSLRLPDGDDVNSIVSRQIAVDGQPKQLFLRSGGMFGSLRVEFQPENGRPLFWVFENTDERDPRYLPSAMLSSHQLIVSLGGSLGLEGLAKDRPPAEQIYVARFDSPEQLRQLPTQWFGYESVDLLALGTSQDLGGDERLLRELSPDNARWQAMSEWVKNGGRLLIFAGGKARDVNALFERLGPLREMLPGRLEEDVSLTRTGQIESAFELTLPAVPVSRERPEISVPLLTDIDGEVRVSQDNVPIVVRAARGFGEVIFVAADFDRPPFSRWEGRAAFIAGMLREQFPAPRSTKDAQGLGEVAHVGISDLSGQLKGALDQFAGISLVPFVLVALLALGYIVLIAPVDYFLVKKVLRRPELTWVTFPSMVLIVSVGAYYLAYWLKGDQIRLNQVDVVDIDLASGQVRGQTWFNVFSPDSRDYDVAVQPQLPGDSEWQPTGAVLSWLGLPGDALGGMDRARSSDFFGGSYRLSPDYDRMLGVPIQVWSSKSFTARWTGKAAPESLGVSANVNPRLGLERTGSVTNHFDFPLRNCLFVAEDQAYQLGDLLPGQTVSLPAGRDLKSLLTGATLGSGASGTQPRFREYNRLGFDVQEILKSMTFYQKVDGLKFTQLLHRYQSHVDLSHVLNPQFKKKRGLFLGFAPNPAAQVTLNGETVRDGHEFKDKHWTCYRIIVELSQ